MLPSDLYLWAFSNIRDATPMAAKVSQKENVGNISINVNAGPTEPQSPPPYQPQFQLQPQFSQVTHPVQVHSQPVFIQPAAQGVVIVSNNLGDTSCMTTCNNCHRRVTTRVIYKSGTFSWVMCFVFIFFGCFCGCCLLPFFMETFQDAHHSCPECHNNLYVHKRM
ncbi:hypothetical protein AAFF_G00080720 [Aldrovandia affinis]|uniref:LITAF domain-containing protein n=1 Tax=Aldrovandia affinis TaxID=143900 RepID=A0AAD7WYD4_9TELE|nr:hypothetical protein AAFF_G00080720 [Aldrovandia affinis]